MQEEASWAQRYFYQRRVSAMDTVRNYTPREDADIEQGVQFAADELRKPTPGTTALIRRNPRRAAGPPGYRRAKP